MNPILQLFNNNGLHELETLWLYRKFDYVPLLFLDFNVFFIKYVRFTCKVKFKKVILIIYRHSVEFLKFYGTIYFVLES